MKSKSRQALFKKRFSSAWSQRLASLYPRAVRRPSFFSVAAADPDGVEVAAIDEGVGIPEEHLPKIWQPRFTSRGESGGNGLGLSLVREIVTSHDARITVESEVGIGSTFRIVFPTSV